MTSDRLLNKHPISCALSKQQIRTLHDMNGNGEDGNNKHTGFEAPLGNRE